MKYACFQHKLYANRRGAVLLLMLLIIVVICGLIWLDPFALSGGNKDKGLPWNQTKRIVPEDKTVPPPTEQQPKFPTYMGIIAKCEENKQDRGEIRLLITPEGRVSGIWFADYSPKPDLRYEVVNCSFKGNIDPEYIYKNDAGEDSSKLYIISKGSFLIMETKGNEMRTANGKVFVTGWADNEYNITGKVTITSDKKTYYEYGFSGKLIKTSPLLFDSSSSPQFRGIPLPKIK